MQSPGWAPGLASLIAGAAWPLAFSPWELYPVAILCLAALFLLWRGATPASAFRRGLLFGLGMFSTGVYWVYISMHDYGYMGPLLSVGITASLVAVLALFPAFAGLLAVRLAGRGDATGAARFAWVLVFPATWALFEWTRGWFLTGFPWLSLGYSQIDAPLAGYAPLIGVYGVSLLAALSASLLLATVNMRDCLRGHWLAVFIVLWAVGGALSLVDWTRSAGAPLTVSLVQGNVPQDLKWHPGMRELTLDIYAELTRPHWGSDLIIWPETAIPMYYHEARPYLDAIAAEAGEHETSLLVGLVYLDHATDRYYNTMINARDRDEIYHKHHLVPFTEYLPFKPLLGRFVDSLAIPMSDFSPGERVQSPIEVAGQKVAMSICYEDAFGEEIIGALPEATLLVNVSNDAWFGDSIAPHQHLQIARMRSLETGRYMARGTNTGMTALIDARGKLVSVAPQFTPHVLEGSVEPRSGATVYVLIGNWGFLVMGFGLLLAGWGLGRRGAFRVPVATARASR